MTKSVADILRKSSRNNKTPLIIGHPDGQDPSTLLTVPYSDREAHMHVIGRTRSGKSRFLADLIRQDIVNRTGLCLIDPHGELYDMTINWLAQNKLVQRIQPKIHPIRLTDPDSMFRFNPLHIDHPREAYSVASNVVGAITRIFGGKDETETPLFSFIADIMCTVLALRGLPLASAKYFILNGALDKEIRQYMITNIEDEYFHYQASQLSQLTAKEFRETVGSSMRRFHKFIRNPMVRRIFSTTENTMQLQDIMDDGHIVLIDASDQGGLLLNNELQAIGSLMVNNIFGAARKRNPRDNPTPFMLYIDEVQNFISADIEDILSQCGKRKVFLTLAHQFLGQLSNAGDLIYSGVMSGAQIKAVFGITMQEADVLADELFSDQIDPERVKEKLATLTTIGYEKTFLHSTSESTSTGRSHTEAEGWAEGESSSDGVTMGAIQSDSFSGDGTSFVHGDAIGHSVTSSDINSSSHSTSATHSVARGVGNSQSKTTGSTQSETYIPITEMLSHQTVPLEEQRYLLKRQLKQQPPRHGYIAILNKGTFGFTARNVPDMRHIPKKEAAYLEHLRNKTPWISSADEIPKELSPEQFLAQLKQENTPLKDSNNSAIPTKTDSKLLGAPDEDEEDWFQ